MTACASNAAASQYTQDQNNSARGTGGESHAEMLTACEMFMTTKASIVRANERHRINQLVGVACHMVEMGEEFSHDRNANSRPRTVDWFACSSGTQKGSAALSQKLETRHDASGSELEQQSGDMTEHQAGRKLRRGERCCPKCPSRASLHGTAAK